MSKLYGWLALLFLVGCGRLGFSSGDSPDASAAACGHTFCDNFDRSSAVEAPYETTSLTGGTLMLGTDQAVSPPRALVADLAFPITGNADLRVTLPMATSKVRLEYDINLELTTPQIAEVDLIILRWVSPPPGCTSFGYYMVRNSTAEMNMQETRGGCPMNSDNYFPQPPPGFHHVLTEITLGAAGVASLHVELDGTPVVNHKMLNYLVPPSQIIFGFGITFARDTTAPWRVRYDNVIIDIE